MISGRVDGKGRCLIPIQIKSARDGDAQSLDVWVDTACTTDLVLSQQDIEAFGLPVSGRVITIPSDGRRLIQRSYSCWIDWFGRQRRVEVVSSEVSCPLLGVGLLLGLRLEVDYSRMSVALHRPVP